MPGIVGFPTALTVVLQLRQVSALWILLCHVHLGRCQEAQVWLGGRALVLVHSTTHGRFPRQHLLTIPGSGSIAYSWGNFPSVISFIIASPPSVLFTLSRIPNGCLWNLQDSIFLFSCFIIFIFLSLSSEFGGYRSHWSSKWLIWVGQYPIHCLASTTFRYFDDCIYFSYWKYFLLSEHFLHKCSICFV